MTEVQTLDQSRWRVTLLAGILVFLVLLFLFRETAQSMVHIWYNFETYTHGFLILPITFWLIWQKRRHLAAFTPVTAPGFLFLVLGGLVAWVLARLTGVLIVEQLAFVGVLVAALGSILGLQVSKFLAFPLLFLFFAVPMGEDLIPPMMEFTATFTVEALRLTGIPVYRDGLWFSLPSGNWSVVEACSGVRYLIASVTLGVMYAYITYHTLWKRLLFVLMSAVVPILANGLRAYMIVMIGHLSEMEYATGVDHLLYGWVFFGIVMFILFWVGSFWQEAEEPPRHIVPPKSHSAYKHAPRTLAVTAVIMMVTAFVVYAADSVEGVEIEMAGQLEAPVQAGSWRLASVPVAWSAAHLPTEHKIEAVYSNGDTELQLYVALFPQQRQGYEAISGQNRLAEELLRSVRQKKKPVQMDDQEIMVNRSKTTVTVDGRDRDYLVWQWYRVAGRNLTNRYEGKAWEAISRIYPGRADGAWIVVTALIDDELNMDVIDDHLLDFVTQLSPQIDAAIDQTLKVGS